MFKRIYISLGILLVLVVGVLIYIIGKNPSLKLDFQQEDRLSERTSIDSTWDKYTNPRLGFSLKIPKLVEGSTGCRQEQRDQYGLTYVTTGGSVPLKVFEDDNMAMLAPEYYYEVGGETQHKVPGYESYIYTYSECKKVVNNTQTVKNSEFPSWRIMLKTAKSDSELDQFIKEQYGPSCRLGDKITTDQKGVYDVKILGDGLPLDETECPVNYATVLRYFPEKQKIASWHLGQACNFAGPEFTSYEDCYDIEMTKSFRFE